MLAQQEVPAPLVPLELALLVKLAILVPLELVLLVNLGLLVPLELVLLVKLDHQVQQNLDLPKPDPQKPNQLVPLDHLVQQPLNHLRA